MIRWIVLLTLISINFCAAQEEEIFTIKKDGLSPWSQILITLPKRHPLYKSFVAKLQDVSENVSDEIRDSNKTFVTSDESPYSIRMHGLRPGHRYSISIYGQKSGSTSLIKEESVTMDPKAPDFRDSGADIQIAEHNITMRTVKNSTNLQDSFSIEYRQINPDKKFPILQILDIADQKNLEFYLGNLNAGFDYSVRVTAHKDGMSSRPWITTITTKPSPLKSLKINQNSGNCVEVVWEFDEFSGADFLALQYAKQNAEIRNSTNMTIPSTETSISICDALQQGEAYQINAIVQKGSQISDQLITKFQLRPLPPIDFRVRPDLKRGKYKMLAELPTTSKIDKCRITVAGDELERIVNDANIEQTKSGHRICWYNFGLSPGERFDFSISSLANESSSQKLQKSIVLSPAFDFNSFGLTLQEANGGIELLWPKSEVFMTRVKDIWNKVVGAKSMLNMRVTPINDEAGKSQKFETNPKHLEPVFVGDLVKGACYRVQLYTVTKTGIISETRHNETIRMSSPSVNVSLESVTRTSATLRLAFSTAQDTPTNNCQLHIIVRDMNSKSIYDKRIQLTQNFAPLLNLDGLRSFHKYTVNTQIICGDNEPAAQQQQCPAATRTMRQLSFSTRQDKPGPVQQVKVEALNSYSVMLSWLPPAFAQCVRAVTEAGFGEISPIIPTVSMPLMPPPTPQIAPIVMKESIKSDHLIVKFPTSIFDNRNGEIKQYAIIVSEISNDDSVNRWLQVDNGTYTWLQVQRFDIWPSYVAKLRTIDKIKQSDDVSIFEEIGDDETCSDIIATDRICNGPLKSGSKYRFRIRLFTSPNMFSDSPTSLVITMNSSTPSLSLFTVALLLAVIVLAGITATLTLCFWNRTKKARLAADVYKNGPSKEKESQWAALKMMMAERAADCLAKLGLDSTSSTTPPPSSGSPTSTASSTTTVDGGHHLGAPNAFGSGQHRRTRSLRERTGVEHRLERLSSGPINRTPLYTVISGVNTNKSRPVRIADFEEHVRMMSADSDFRFSEEYEMMKNVGCGQSIHASEMAVNRPKNRFTNILPYDHSRVRLTSQDNSPGADYINANYMPGFSSRREFIAAQGPLPTTRDAFWQMTWEQQCPAIIALTKCVEKGRDKCHQYWPDSVNSPQMYGEIEVTLMAEKHYDEFIIRDLRLDRKDGAASRIVRHWHYMAWPDFGVPQHPSGISQFVKMFRHHLPPSPNNLPTIVHCSAGVGRSGTFIAIDRLIQTIALDSPIDVFGIVCEMRYERCQMVQNEQQYIFIHICLLHILKELQTGHINNAYDSCTSIAESGF
ncbi:unnamed protein product [Caenorhabditis angaria]|uniref:protein-tyrosine-phosphatase n=1 Tax=Caenorhabditis angaria TaxID=860376 RepID=A0A9P1I9G6_9PELO|nr:unnamed protein product [Caenorhabditis angaria]